MLTQKESNLLKDLKKEEQLSVQKYNKAATAASAPALKSLFQQIEQGEQQHLNTISQIMNGVIPEANAANNSSSQSNQQPQNLAQPASYENTKNKQNDCFLCSDALDSEKYISGAYEAFGFEFAEQNIRNALLQIQQEEHAHGKMLYDYMSQNGMYS